MLRVKARQRVDRLRLLLEIRVLKLFWGLYCRRLDFSSGWVSFPVKGERK